VRIRSVQTDRLHTDLEALPAIVTENRVTIAYEAMDQTPRGGRRQYRRRLVAADGEALVDWHNARDSALDVAFAEAGDYVFEVMAVSRDLEYSEVASLALTVVPPWHARGSVLLLAGGFLAALVMSSLFYSRRYYLQRRETGLLRERMLDQERSARVELEEAYLEVQRLLRIEERTAVILRGWAHAVKSPLTIIRRQLGREGDDLPERVESIVGTVDRILGAAVDVQRRHFDLRSELNLLLYRTVQEYPGVEMEAAAGDAVRVNADHAKLVMAFENLFHNACQALDGSGKVRLAIEEGDTAVRVEVADDGPGIADDIRERLFEHTVTTRKDRGGTGLGLLITQHVIDAHGGRIRVASTSPAGTTIAVELPRGE
jgi:signal transduction histidine kinase